MQPTTQSKQIKKTIILHKNNIINKIKHINEFYS